MNAHIIFSSFPYLYSSQRTETQQITNQEINPKQIIDRACIKIRTFERRENSLLFCKEKLEKI